MSKKYLYLAIVMALVVTLTAVTSFNFSPKENKTLVVENVTEVPEPKGASVNANKKHNHDGAVRDTETVLPRVAVNNDFKYESFFSLDEGEEFVKQNVTQLADILEISDPAERDILESITRKQAANAKKLSDNYYSLMREASDNNVNDIHQKPVAA